MSEEQQAKSLCFLEMHKGLECKEGGLEFAADAHSACTWLSTPAPPSLEITVDFRLVGCGSQDSASLEVTCLTDYINIEVVQ